MSDTSIGVEDLARDQQPDHQVWVLEDPLDGVGDPALGVAERLGVPFRRIPLSWNWLAPLAALGRRGSLLGLAPVGHERLVDGIAWRPPSAPRREFASAAGPALILSSGRRASAVALWLKSRFSSPLVQCMHAGPRGADIDLVVMPRHLVGGAARGIMPVLGVPHRLSPLLLHQARSAWRERLSHMPRPRVALLADGPMGGTDMRPAAAHGLGQVVAGLVRQGGGSVLAHASARTGSEATEALSAGLSSVMHVLHRWGEPGEDPYLGMLASAEAVVVAGGSMGTLSEACATEGPVFIALPEMQGLRHRGLHESFYEAGQARPIGEDSVALAPPTARRGRPGGDLDTGPFPARLRSFAMDRVHRIAVIPGDGIGKETVPEGLRVLDAAARRFGFELKLDHYDWSCETYQKTGAMMPADGLDRLRDCDSIFLGAVGFPGVPDHVSLWGLLIPLRRGFDQYVNLRPCKLMPGAKTPLAGRTEADIDFFVVRENTEGEYSSSGGRMFEGTEREFVTQQSVFTRVGVDRVLKYAFELAMTRPRRHVTSATKSNGITFTMPYWDERFAAMAKNYPDVGTAQFHIDILCAHFVQHPDWFDVVVGSNLFGDILSDLGPAVAGSIGIAPSANINPERVYPSMFEPVHGSAPDIAGRHICNPIGQIWSGAMMLEHLGETAAAAAIVGAIETLLREGGPRTPDLGGQAATSDVGRALAEVVSRV